MSNRCQVHDIHLFAGELCRKCVYGTDEQDLEPTHQPGSIFYTGNDPEHKRLLRMNLKNGAYGKRDL